ncbi:MAG TPA: MerR family transcriptional regulator, partial [Vicinamibacterales bacterium]|nr:MerR family transcriptional regulator [Vicinamibacterales bacterium]
LSRSTLLYYEAQGLLRRPSRTAGNYRVYTEDDLQRVQQIVRYRHVGLSVREIAALLGKRGGGAAAILQRRLAAIDAEIETLRRHQRTVLRLLQGSHRFRRDEMMTKDRWVAIMRAAGLSEDDMQRWHLEFEKAAPEEHQEFLEFLHISAEEIAQIREWSRKTQGA